MEDTTDLKWRKSTYSSNGGGECVDVADQAGRVLVRDTKDRSGPVLSVSAEAWRRFAGQVKRALARISAQEVGRKLRVEGAREAAGVTCGNADRSVQES